MRQGVQNAQDTGRARPDADRRSPPPVANGRLWPRRFAGGAAARGRGQPGGDHREQPGGDERATDSPAATAAGSQAATSGAPSAPAAAASPARARGPQTVAVRRGAIAELLPLSGRVGGMEEVPLSFPLAGRAEAVRVKPGQAVEAGRYSSRPTRRMLQRSSLPRAPDSTAPPPAWSRRWRRPMLSSEMPCAERLPNVPSARMPSRRPRPGCAAP